MKALLFILLLLVCGCSENKKPQKSPKTDALHVPQATVQHTTEQTLGEASTVIIDDGINRVYNIKLACSHISGTALAPGQEFSFNAIVGKRSHENGWLDAPVIIDGKREYGAGGGICQVSTTLYLAAVNAGLEITEHHCHSEPVAYARPGCDATVVYGAKDLKFKNSSENTVFLYLWTSDEKIFAKIIKNC